MISRLFTLPPIVYFILAPLAVVLGVSMFVFENGQDSERTSALSHAAPEPVEIQSVMSDVTGNDFNEIVVAGQADMDNMIEMVTTRRGSERDRALFIPFHSTEATDFTAPALAIVEIDGVVSDEMLEQFYAGEGPVGPVLMVNGVLEGGVNSDASDAMVGHAEMTANFFTIRPFMDGREEGLKVTGAGPTMAILGLIFAGILGGYGYFRKKREEKLHAEGIALYAEAFPEEYAAAQNQAQARAEAEARGAANKGLEGTDSSHGSGPTER